MTPEVKKNILDFLKRCPVASLSTCSPQGHPESSAIYYHVDDELNFYFITKEFTRKSHNLIKNPHVALLFFSHEDLKTLQVEGVAKNLGGQEARLIFDRLIEKISEFSKNWPPPLGKIDAGNVILYRIEIDWARLGDFKNFNIQGFEQLIGQ